MDYLRKLTGLNRKSKEGSGAQEIGHPTAVAHVHHVFVSSTGELKGLPDQWMKLLERELA